MTPKKSFTVFSAFVFLFLPIILTLSQHSAIASQGDIHTFAGLGRGYAGDGGVATAALLNFPGAVAVDASGNLYISDMANQRIRKVDASGNISTVAGTGKPGFSGDGGAASQARINNPSGVAVDGAGDVLFADTGNSRIRMISPAGIITTIAGTGRPGYAGDGGAAALASINHAEGVAVDAKGNIYISDTGNNRIRMISPAGIITTIAGTGRPGYAGDGGSATSASLNRPAGVAVDSSGRIYIADCYNQRVRVIGASGTITTPAGTGRAGYSGDGGPAASAKLSFPSGVAVDSSGRIYIADCYNQRVRVIGASGTITTLAGTGKAGFSGDGSPAGDAMLSRPFGVAVNASGDVFIADSRNNRIRMVEGPSYALPVSTITSPKNGVITYSDGSGITITGMSSALNGISFVEVSTDGGTTWQTATGTTSWSYTWNPPQKGLYIIMSRATDSQGKIETIVNCQLVRAVFKYVPISVTLAPNQPDSTPGQTVSWTAAASGGNGNYQYQFLRKGPDTGGSYAMMKDWSGSGAWDWNVNTSSVGDNTVMVNVMDSTTNTALMKSTSSTTRGKGSKTAPFKVNKAITINSITPSETSAVEGNKVTWTVTASGGSGSYLYEFMRMGPDTNGVYIVAQGYGTSNSWSWTTTSAMVGSNTILVYVKNSDGTGEVSSQTPAYTVSWPAIVVNSLVPSVASPATAGNAVTFTASASGGSGNLQYQFMRMGPDTGGTYVVAQNWSGSSSWNWVTTSSMAGTNTIMVNARNSDGSGTVSTSITYTIAQAVAAIVIGSVTPSIPSPDIVGTPVVWAAAATGGPGSYQYQFSRTGPDTGGAAVVTQAWGTSNTWSWTPTTAMVGNNTITVSVRNSDGTGVVSLSAPTYTVNYQPIAATSFTPSPASATAGASIVWTAAATGGSGNYQYQFSRTGPDTGGAAVVTQAWGTSNTWTWNTTSLMSGNNTISVSVKDSAGAIATATAGYTLLSPSGLVGYWKFDEGSGTTTADSSGLGNNGTLNGATWVSGVSGDAVSFDGTGTYVEVPGTSALEPTSTVSVTAWVKTTTAPALGGEVVSMGDNYVLRVLSDGNVFFFFYNGTTWITVQTTGVNVLDGRWHNIAGVKSASQIQIFVDGVSKAAYSTSDTIPYTLGTNLYFGKHGNGSTSYNFNGVIDDVRIYNTALSATDVQNIYAAITPPATPISASITASPTTATAGSTVTLTASANGGSGSYQYQFSRLGPDTGGTAVITQAWGTSSTWSWNTSSAMIGTNTITVSVKDSSGNTTTSSVDYSLASASTGNAYYISPSGSDSSGNGSINSPWLTWTYASSKLKPGDTLYARGGTYYNQGGFGPSSVNDTNWLSPSGTQTAPITFKAYPGETPVFDGGATAATGGWSGGVGQGMFLANGVSWIIIDGVTFQHYSGTGVITASASDQGLGTASNIVIQNVTIRECGSDPSHDNGIYLGAGASNFTIRNNLVYSVAAVGITGWHAPGAVNTSIYNNIVYSCNIGICFGDGANGLYVYNNTIDRCNYGVDEGEAGDTDPVGVYNAVVENNILTDNAVCGLRVGSFDSTQVSSDYNLYYGNASDIIWTGTSYKLAGFQSAKPEVSGNELHSISANPLYVDAAAGNYQLNSGSPAIGAGTTISAVPYNYDYATRQTPFNIGAY